MTLQFFFSSWVWAVFCLECFINATKRHFLAGLCSWSPKIADLRLSNDESWNTQQIAFFWHQQTHSRGFKGAVKVDWRKKNLHRSEKQNDDSCSWWADTHWTRCTPLKCVSSSAWLRQWSLGFFFKRSPRLDQIQIAGCICVLQGFQWSSAAIPSGPTVQLLWECEGSETPSWVLQFERSVNETHVWLQTKQEARESERERERIPLCKCYSMSWFNDVMVDMLKVTSEQKHCYCPRTVCLTFSSAETSVFQEYFLEPSFCLFSTDGLLKVIIECASTR